MKAHVFALTFVFLFVLVWLSMLDAQIKNERAVNHAQTELLQVIVNLQKENNYATNFCEVFARDIADITNRLAKCEAHAKSWHVRKVPTAGERAFADEIRRVETNSAGGVSVILKAKPQPFDGVTYIQEL